ncbi:hypothetical protein B0H63DRAFT_521778 [Podospora didyma]|uniref:Uncharacterized protein n=1 Tax=Podospora didyma TaxID=330526 RepID=A0AAE0NU31_9PEZI|nr:hypothetical protein B0H63DRAFT_521778 [Podospora didyma]
MVKGQETQIRQAQTLAFGGIEGDSWVAGDDSTVRADLETLQGRVKSWAKNYAVKELEIVDCLAPEEYTSLVGLLSRFLRMDKKPHAGVEGGENPAQLAIPKLLQTPGLNKKSPALCLQAALADQLYANIIEQPFFALGD